MRDPYCAPLGLELPSRVERQGNVGGFHDSIEQLG
jgi:hypothetical protein